jgi:signal transduction histidine kinase
VAGLAVTLLATALVGLSVRARNRQDGLTGQIREARDALAAAQRERNRISRDLHDGTIQSLYAIQLGLGHTVEKIEGEPARTQRELSAVRRDLDAVIAEIRQFITAEAEPEKAVDLGAVLHALVERVRPGTKAEIVLHCDPAATECLTVGQAVHLANIAREALSNSLRHAQPQRVEITLRPEPEAVVLEVRDDGAGFDPDAPDRTGGGLGNMTARAREMNGTLDLESERGRGTRVTVRVPASPLAATETESPDDRDDES